MGEVLRYDSATFIRPRLGKPGKGDLRVFPGADPPRTEEQFNFAVITEFHETEWSGEVSSPNGGFEAAEITKAVSYERRDLKGTRIEPGEQNIEGDLLSIFQKAHSRAQELRVMASPLTPRQVWRRPGQGHPYRHLQWNPTRPTSYRIGLVCSRRPAPSTWSTATSRVVNWANGFHDLALDTWPKGRPSPGGDRPRPRR